METFAFDVDLCSHFTSAPLHSLVVFRLCFSYRSRAAFPFIVQTKAPSLWLCYARAHWKMFAFGGLLKLFGDLTALVGPVAITKIVEYIQINFNASSVSLTQSTPELAADRMGRNIGGNATETSADRPDHYFSVASQSFLSSPPSTSFAAPMINENTEIYYPTWNEFMSNGWIISLFVLFSTLAQGSLSQASTHIANMIGIRLRSSLQSLVYRKTLLISTSCFFTDAVDPSRASADADSRRPSAESVAGTHEIDAMNKKSTITGGEQRQQQQKQQSTVHRDDGDAKNVDAGTITNLMSEDALNVMSFFWIAHYVWAIPVKVSRCRSLPAAPG